MANDYTEFLQGFKGNQNTKSIEEKYEDKIKSLKSDLEDRDANIKTLKKMLYNFTIYNYNCKFKII